MSEDSQVTKIFLVDAFTESPFSGNPAGVCYVPGSYGNEFPLSDEKMQKIAAEMNVSETAFIQPLNEGEHPTEFLLRWFTPTVEVKLCGHGTVSASTIIFNQFYLNKLIIILITIFVYSLVIMAVKKRY